MLEHPSPVRSYEPRDAGVRPRPTRSSHPQVARNRQTSPSESDHPPLRARGRGLIRYARASHAPRGGSDERRAHDASTLRPEDIPTGVVQPPAEHRAGRHAAAAAAASRDEEAGRPGRPRAAVPRGADHAGGLDRAVDRHPRPGPRRLPALEADAAVPRPPARSRRCRRPRTSTSSTRARRRPARTSRTPPSRRPTTTRRRASGGSRPRRAPGSGARRCRWRAASSTSSASCSW